VPGSAPVEAVTVAAAIGYYVLGGRGSDLGAIVGHQADERQASIRIRARALAAQVAGLAAVAGYVIELARRASSGRLSSSPSSWPALFSLAW
jgi:hypothetical protein